MSSLFSCRLITSFMILGLSSRAMAADESAFEASYTVPRGTILAEDLSIPLTNARIWQDADRIYLVYDLPKELDGAQPKNIMLDGKAGPLPVTLKGGNASAACSKQDGITSCRVRYKHLRLNHTAADAFLASHIESPDQRMMLQEAREELEHQAVGIVTFRPVEGP